MTLKILNLYTGIGGNRKLWTGDIEVTAVELDTKIAKIYQDFFPNDKVIVTDAHQFLLEHYKEFDFIWSSPPCPSHSHIRKELGVDLGILKPLYPDMKLYEEIIFLNHFCKCKFVVENVRSYYKPLINPQELQRHYFWCNFNIGSQRFEKDDIHLGTLEKRQKTLGFNLSKSEVGLHIFNMAFKDKQKRLVDLT